MPDSSQGSRSTGQTHRIGIIRFSALGDIVHTLPAFSQLRQTYHGSHITWFVHPSGARLLSLVKGIDAIEVVTLKGIPVHERLRRLRRTVNQYRHQFDLVIDFQGLIKSAVFAALLGGKRVGFSKADLREPLAACCYTNNPTPFGGVHVIDRNLHLLSALNIPPPLNIDFAIQVSAPNPDSREGQVVLKLVGNIIRPLCLINLGGAWPTKQFDANFWVSLLEALSPTMTPMLIWGLEFESELAAQIADRHPVLISPFLSFPDLVWLISRSKAVVSCDSLALHLAEALSVPSIGLFGPTNPARNGSKMSGSRSIRADVPCDYCYKRECDKMWCRQNLSPIQTAYLINEVMGQDD